MMDKIAKRLLMITIVIGGCLVTSAYANTTNSAIESARTIVTVNSERVLAKDRSSTATSKVNNKTSDRTGSISKKAKTASRSVVPAYDEMEMEASCARGGDCTCTSKNHAVTHCYAGRGDCYNHEGLLCIWG